MRSLIDRFSIWPGWAQATTIVVAVALVAGIAAGGTVLAVHSGLRPSLPGRTARTPASAARPSATISFAQPSPGASSAPVAGSLRCRLPISNGQPGSGGFVEFPGGAFVPDPASSVQSQTAYGLMWDRAYSRWLPVPRSYVSPDGSRYAYWDYRSGSLEAASVTDGSITHLGPKPSGAASAARVNTGFWQPVEALDSGVYAIPAAPPSAGLWLFPWSGAGEQQITGAGYWQAIGGGAAWGTASQSVPQGASNTLLKLPLTGGGTAVEWFSRPGLQSRVVGFDAGGAPVVEASAPGANEVWLVTGQQAGNRLLAIPQPTPGQGGQPRGGLMSVVGDGNGIWLATSAGLYLVTSAGTEKVSTVTGMLGGGCA